MGVSKQWVKSKSCQVPFLNPCTEVLCGPGPLMGTSHHPGFFLFSEIALFPMVP